MQKASFLKGAAMTTDICTHLKKMSLFIQKADCNIADCHGVMQSTIGGLDKLKMKYTRDSTLADDSHTRDSPMTRTLETRQ